MKMSEGATMEKVTAQSLMDIIPGEVLEIFGDEPILSTEDSTRYHAMIAAFAQHVDPGDFITWCYIKDLADYRTEIWRYRRMKAQTVDNAHRAVIEKRLDEFRTALAKAPTEIRTRLVTAANEEIKQRGLHGDEYAAFVADLETRIEAKIKARQDGLRENIDHWRAYEPDESDLAGELHVWIGQHHALDQQISLAEEKYTSALEDLERHLFGFGKALRGDLHKIIEGEIVERGVGEIQADSVDGEANSRRRRLASGNDS
jgi:hypothetical protein